MRPSTPSVESRPPLAAVATARADTRPEREGLPADEPESFTCWCCFSATVEYQGDRCGMCAEACFAPCCIAEGG